MVKPLVSVIIPIYNIEKYLEDAIKSVIDQNVDFESSIELILVDDGSTDGSRDIAQHYLRKYPNNIIFIHQKNSGVSRARNRGFSRASGKYIHFFDGDDKLSKNFYQDMIAFLNTHKQVDFVASKLMFFDEIIDSHPLNYKFKKTKVIELADDPDNPILHVISCVFRKESIERFKFDESLSIAEDVKFLSDVLVLNARYGVVNSVTYHYRKRTNTTSAIGGKEKNRDYYLAVPDRAYGHMLDSWQGRSDLIVPIEYTVMYDISYRLAQREQTILSKKEEDAYKENIYSIAARCSDEVIISSTALSIHQKIHLLRKKHGSSFEKKLHTQSGVLYFNNRVLYNFADSAVFLDLLNEEKDGKYTVEGYIEGLTNITQASYFLQTSEGVNEELSFTPRMQREESFLGDTYHNGGAFKVCLPVASNTRLQFIINTTDTSTGISLATGRYTRLGSLKFSYRRDKTRLFRRVPAGLQSYAYSYKKHLLFELLFLINILLDWRIGAAIKQLNKLRSRNLVHLNAKTKLFEILKPGLVVAEAIVKAPVSVVLRIAYYVYVKSERSRRIWIVSDRGMAAGDNGESFFKYAVSVHDPDVNIFFALSKRSKDFKRLSDIGQVLNYASFSYKLHFLLSEKIISSHADIEVTNPFLRQIDHFVDMFTFDFIFLQHGIIRNNLSGWLNRYEKNIALFVTSAKSEYDSLFTYPYYYSKEQVILSGLPRYDELESDTMKKIIIAPTYRNNLLRLNTDKYGERPYDAQFKHSDYFKFYNNLINDPNLLSNMKNAGIKGELYIHPNFSAQTSDFKGNKFFTVKSYPYDYRKAIAEGALLVTDYSSIVFDFAYLYKPVIYSQFDSDIFYSTHSYSRGDFFIDERDGFGVVCNDYSSLIEAIENSIRDNFKVEDIYEQRIRSFFYKFDKRNNKRIYDRIMEL